MKDIVDDIVDSLHESFNVEPEKLKNALNKKYGIEDLYDYKSECFTLSVDEDLYNRLTNDAGFFKLIDLCGYTIAEINCINKKTYDLHLEPNFGKKCNELVYDKCDGIVWYVTKKEFEKYIVQNGIKQRADEHLFLSCGEMSQDIIDNVKFLLKQLDIPEGEYVIYKIDLKFNRHHPYKVNFYYDQSEDDKHNFIYANAMFFPHYIANEFYSVDDMQNYLKKIDGNLVFKIMKQRGKI